MFLGAPLFNSDLNTWNTSAVVDMLAMFDGATSFDSVLDAWDVR